MKSKLIKFANTIKNLLINLLLFVTSIVLLIPLTIINIVLVLIKYRKDGLLKTLSSYFYETAFDVDRFGNRNLRTLLNLTLKTPDGYSFGDINETISKVLGVNQKNKTLTKTGCLICKILDFFDKNHCKKSVR